MTNASDTHCVVYSFSRLVFTSIILSLTACATPAPTFIELKPEIANKIHSAKVYSVLRQDTVYARAEPVPYTPHTGGKKAGMYFGAIGVILGATGDAIGDMFTSGNQVRPDETQIAPLRVALSGYDLREEFWSQLRLELKNQTRLKIEDIVTRTQPLSNKERTKIIQEMSEDALLIIDTSYYMSPGFDVLNMDSAVSLWLKGKEELVYLQTLYYYSKPLPENGDEAVKKWAENNGERFRNAVQEGTQETFKMLNSKLLN